MSKMMRMAAAALLIGAAVTVSAAPAAAAIETWDGGGADANWTTAENWADDTAPQPGDTLVFPADPVSRKSSSNDYPADTPFIIDVTGTGFTLAGNRVALGSSTSRIGVGGPTNTVALDLLLTGGVRTVQGTGGRITGDVVMAVSDPGAHMNASGVVIDGVVSGPGNVMLLGTTLTGDNTYTGATNVAPGSTRIDGNQPASAVTLSSADGVLAGDGTVGPLDGGTAGGEIALGLSDQLVAQGNFTSSTGVHAFELSGTSPGTNHGQLVVNGAVTLRDGANLVVDDTVPPPDAGTEFVVIANDANDPVNGRFRSTGSEGDGGVLEEGALDTFGGNGVYEISYAGGDGNDITLTAVSLPLVVVGSAAGPPTVDVFANGGERVGDTFAPYPGFGGGVNVALGDFNGDGSSDLVTAPRVGGGPHVKVFVGGRALGFMAYDTSFSGGVALAAADLDSDGRDEIITGAGPGGGPHVKVFEIVGTSVVAVGGGFFPYDPAFRGGVNVGGLRRSGADGIITGAGSGGGPHVRVFDAGGAAVDDGGFMAYDPKMLSGVYVSGLTVGGVAKMVTAPGRGGGPHVRVFDLAGAEEAGFMAYDPKLTTGVFVAALPRETGNTQDIITGPAAGGPHVRVVTAAAVPVFEFMARTPATGGATVAGGLVR